MSVSSDSHSPFPVLPTRSDSARPLSTHSASGQETQDSSPSFRFCLIDLILSIRFSPYQILSRGCGFCLRIFSAAGFLAARPDSRFLIPVFARRGAVARGRPAVCVEPIALMCTRRILRATHFAIEVRSALRTVQSLLNGGSSHVRQRSHGRWHGGARAVRGRSDSGQAVSQRHSRGRLVPGFERHAGVRCSLAPACGDPASGRWCCSAMLTAARLLFCCGECCLIGSPSPRARCECTRQLGSSAAVWV